MLQGLRLSDPLAPLFSLSSLGVAWGGAFVPAMRRAPGRRHAQAGPVVLHDQAVEPEPKALLLPGKDLAVVPEHIGTLRPPRRPGRGAGAQGQAPAPLRHRAACSRACACLTRLTHCFPCHRWGCLGWGICPGHAPCSRAETCPGRAGAAPGPGLGAGAPGVASARQGHGRGVVAHGHASAPSKIHGHAIQDLAVVPEPRGVPSARQGSGRGAGAHDQVVASSEIRPRAQYYRSLDLLTKLVYSLLYPKINKEELR